MLVVTVGGILIVSSLIGVLTTGMNNRITELRKGRSPVLARGHTVLLGWSDQVFTIVAELVKANQANRPVRRGDPGRSGQDRHAGPAPDPGRRHWAATNNLPLR